jgi:hypothetical protein
MSSTLTRLESPPASQANLVLSTLSRNRRIIATTLRGLGSGVIRRRAEFRHHVVRDVWTVAKRFGADSVENIEFREIPFLWEARVEGYLEDQQRLVIAALTGGLGAHTFFEIGTNRGRTTWTVARNNPELEVFTLEVGPDESSQQTRFALGADDLWCFRDDTCGEAFRNTPEAERITQLWGDSGQFDFSPYENKMETRWTSSTSTALTPTTTSRATRRMRCGCSARRAPSHGTTTRPEPASTST